MVMYDNELARKWNKIWTKNKSDKDKIIFQVFIGIRYIQEIKASAVLWGMYTILTKNNNKWSGARLVNII